MSRSRGLAYKQRGKQLEIPLGLELAAVGEQKPCLDLAQQPSVLIIVIYISIKTTSEILSLFKNSSKAEIWSIRISIKELYSYAYGVSFKP
jgi:hypothetical protein